MKINFPILAVCGVSLLVAMAGCSRKSSVSTELDKATSIMEQPVPVQPMAAAPVQTEQPAQPEPPPDVTPVPAPAQEMKQAVAAYKSGDLEDAVTRLQKLRATPIMSPQQRIALNDAMAAVMGEIYGLAANGNQRAIQAVKQYETLQTKPR
ncbi:MAG: hypothetical protein WCQ21_35920 [Verrucomicrobiota bacterium]|jgi:hypothetical protein